MICLDFELIWRIISPDFCWPEFEIVQNSWMIGRLDAKTYPCPRCYCKQSSRRYFCFNSRGWNITVIFSTYWKGYMGMNQSTIYHSPQTWVTWKQQYISPKQIWVFSSNLKNKSISKPKILFPAIRRRKNRETRQGGAVRQAPLGEEISLSPLP